MMMQQEVIRKLLLGVTVLLLSNCLPRGESESGRALLAFDCNVVELLPFKTSKS
jgi:hypothetical protein